MTFPFGGCFIHVFVPSCIHGGRDGTSVHSLSHAFEYSRRTASSLTRATPVPEVFETTHSLISTCQKNITIRPTHTMHKSIPPSGRATPFGTGRTVRLFAHCTSALFHRTLFRPHLNGTLKPPPLCVHKESTPSERNHKRGFLRLAAWEFHLSSGWDSGTRSHLAEPPSSAAASHVHLQHLCSSTDHCLRVSSKSGQPDCTGQAISTGTLRTGPDGDSFFTVKGHGCGGVSAGHWI